MHWKLVFSISAVGLVMGVASVLGFTQRIEGILWLLISLACAVWLARRVPQRPFGHGFLVGLLGGSAAPLIQVVFFSTYLANNPDSAKELAEVPADWNPRLLVLAMLPAIGIVSGLALGLLTLLAARWTRGASRGATADQPRRGIEWWVWAAIVATLLHVACFAIPYMRPGPLGRELWSIGLDGILWPALGLILIACGVVRSARRRPFCAPWRIAGFVLLPLISVNPWFAQILPVFFIPYPSSHNEHPSAVEFRLPLDGPVTVFWGGGDPLKNYHAVAPDQCWAYDLTVTNDGRTFHGDGTKHEDYYCYGAPVLAPADGTVHSIEDGHPDMPVGEMGGAPAGGNQVVVEVAPREYLFLCHMQPGSIAVKPGDRVVAGQVLGRVGNSGNTSEPHLHIHLQDSPVDGDGEGIPLYFHHYRVGGQLVDRGIPTGGLSDRQTVEQSR